MGGDRWAGVRIDGQGRAGAAMGKEVLWKEGMEERWAGGDSVGSGETEENQKGATRPALTIPNLNIPEGCFRA